MFYFDEAEINDILMSINNNIGQTYTLSDDFNGNINRMTTSGLYGNGVDVVASQVNCVKEGLESFKTITSRSLDNIVNFELDLAKKAETIYVPQDFDSTDTATSSSFTEFSYDKEDGRSVTDSNESTLQSYDKSYSNVNATDIDRLKVSDTSEKILTDYQKVKEKKIENIVSDEEQEEKILSDYVDTEKSYMGRVDKGITDLPVIDLNDSSQIKQVKMYEKDNNDISLEDIDFGEEL